MLRPCGIQDPAPTGPHQAPVDSASGAAVRICLYNAPPKRPDRLPGCRAAKSEGGLMFRRMMLGMYLAAMVLLVPSGALAKVLPAHAPGRAPSQAAGNTVEATESGGGANFVFVPDTITVKTGDTVTFKNTGKVPHTATADDGSFDFTPLI